MEILEFAGSFLFGLILGALTALVLCVYFKVVTPEMLEKRIGVLKSGLEQLDEVTEDGKSE